MKNNILDIFFGFALALPIALIIGVVPTLFNNQPQGGLTAMTFWIFVIGFPSLSWRCVEIRRLRKRELDNMLITLMLLLPLAAIAAIYGLAADRGGLVGTFDAIFRQVVGAMTVACGWLGATLAFSTRNKAGAP